MNTFSKQKLNKRNMTITCTMLDVSIEATACAQSDAVWPADSRWPKEPCVSRWCICSDDYVTKDSLPMIPGVQWEISYGEREALGDRQRREGAASVTAALFTVAHGCSGAGTRGRRPPLFDRGDASPTLPLFRTEIRAKVSSLLQLVTYWNTV